MNTQGEIWVKWDAWGKMGQRSNKHQVSYIRIKDQDKLDSSQLKDKGNVYKTLSLFFCVCDQLDLMIFFQYTAIRGYLMSRFQDWDHDS